MRFLKSVFLMAICIASPVMADDWEDMETQFIVKNNGITYDIKNRTKGWDDVRITTPIGDTGVSVRFWYKNKPGLHRYRAEFSPKSFTGSLGALKLWAKPSFMLNAGDGYDKPVAAIYAGGYTSVSKKVSLYADMSKWVKTEDGSHSFAYYRYGVSYKVDPNMTMSLGVLDKQNKNWQSYAKDVQLAFKYTFK